MLTGKTTVYLCTWKRRKGKIVLILAGDPDISASGKDLQEADEKLCKILEAKPDSGEAILEYLRLAPKDALAKRFSDPDLVLVTGHGKPGPLLNPESIYAHPPCPACKRQRRERTPEPARFQSLPHADSGMGQGCGHLYSQRFLDRLTDEERGQFKLRQVLAEEPGDAAFFELHAETDIEFTGVRDFPGRIGGACPECGMVSFTYIMDWKVLNFVARDDLPRHLPGVFPVRDDMGDTRLAMTRDRYLELRPGPGMEGVVSSPLFVATDQVLRRED